MAKNNGKNLNNGNGKAQGQKDVPSQKTAVPPASQNESHGGLIAAIIAVIALLFIGGGILAFVLFLKAKNYFNSAATNITGELQTGLSATYPDYSQLNAGIIPGDTSPFASSSAPYGAGANGPTYPAWPPAGWTPTPTPTPATPDFPPPTTPDEPQPTPVGSYNFDSAISSMDSSINQTNENALDPNIAADSYFGF